MKTWQAEALVVSAVLACTKLATHAAPIEWVGSLAVLFTFLHTQIGFRFTEAADRAGQRAAAHDVECHAWMGRYFAVKETLWMAYFSYLGARSAMVGVGVFLVYPVWRKWMRR